LKILRLYSLMVLCSSLPVVLHAQSDTFTTGWYQYFGEHQIADKWSLHAEAQIRRDSVVTRWEQLLLRPGLTYHFSPHITAMLGYTYFRTFDYEGTNAASREHRLFEELKWKRPWGRVDIENRFRLEQRFIKMIASQEQGFQPAQRVRHRLQVRIPLKATTVKRSRVYLSLYNELFINATNLEDSETLDQNRSYGALGLNLSENNQLEVGYMYRFFPMSGMANQQEHSLQFSIYSSVPFFH
jgi:hypothetical protein